MFHASISGYHFRTFVPVHLHFCQYAALSLAMPRPKPVSLHFHVVVLHFLPLPGLGVLKVDCKMPIPNIKWSNPLYPVDPCQRTRQTVSKHACPGPLHAPFMRVRLRPGHASQSFLLFSPNSPPLFPLFCPMLRTPEKAY